MLTKMKMSERKVYVISQLIFGGQENLEENFVSSKFH